MTADAKRSCATYGALIHKGKLIDDEGWQDTNAQEYVAAADYEALQRVLARERGYLISCPWCFEQMESRPISAQMMHVIACGDKRAGTTVSETVPNPPPGMLWVDEQSFRIIVSTLTKEQMREVCLKEGERLFKNAKIGAFINADGSVTPERDASAPSATPRSTELKFCPMCEKEWESDVR